MRIIQVEVERTRQAAQFEPERVKAIAALDDEDDRARCTQDLRAWVRDQLFTPLPDAVQGESPESGTVVEPSYRGAARPVGQTPLGQAQARLRAVAEQGDLTGRGTMYQAAYLLDRLESTPPLRYTDLTVRNLTERVIPYLEHWVLARDQVYAWAAAAEVEVDTLVRQFVPEAADDLWTLTLVEWEQIGAALRTTLVKAGTPLTVLTTLPDGTTPGPMDWIDDAVPPPVPAAAVPAAVYHQPAPIPAVAPRPPQPQPAAGGGGGGKPVPGDGAVTEKQLRAIYAIARAARHLSGAEVDARCKELYGGKLPSDLTKKEGSQLIDALKGETPA